MRMIYPHIIYIATLSYIHCNITRMKNSIDDANRGWGFMKRNGNRCVATGLDDNYVFPFLVMAFSAQINRQKDFNLKIAFGKGLLQEKNRKLISQVLTVLDISYEFISVDLDSRLRSERWIAVTSFIRLHLADTLPEKFLWLDGDLICLKGWDKIFDEYEYSIEKHAICAAVDTVPLLNLVSRSPYNRNAAIQRMGQNYFNAGVLLVNPNLWRVINKKNHWQELYDHYNEMGFQFADQCILNHLCSNSYSHIDKSYNVFASIRKKYASNGKIKIMHFAGEEKPWFYKKFDFAIISSSLRSMDILKYIRLQSELIKIVSKKNSDLGAKLRVAQKELHRDISNIQVWHHQIYKLKKNLRMRYIKSFLFQRFYYLDRLNWFINKKRNATEVGETSNEIVAITVSVNYSQVLDYVLKKNISIISSWIVVTEPDDIATIEVVRKHPNIELLFFDFKAHGRKFNKGGGIRMAQKYAYQKYPNHWYLLLDSDISLRTSADLHQVKQLDNRLIYLSSNRRDYLYFSDLAKQESFTPYDGPIQSGFFQLYRQKRFYFDSWDASRCDRWFADDFPEFKVLPNTSCDHLGMAGNWDGTKGTRFSFD
jgi:lipopolysaccharide biosynthesis glycosyltransferase